jgi:radical SAM family protein
MVTLEELRRNPALLKLDLYCKGIRIEESCHEGRGGRKILRTRAGLGSGLEVVLPGELWTNIPVTEHFAKESPYTLTWSEEGGLLIRHDGEPVAPVRLSPQPAWYEHKTASGRRMSRVGTLQGTYLGIYPARVCEFWTEEVKSNCRFCSVGLNLGADDSDEKSVQDVLETVLAAREESGITYVDFNTGHDEEEGYLDTLEPYIRAVKENTGLLVGVQTPPHSDLKRYDWLRTLGVNRVSFCFELFDPQRFKEVCPGKCRTYGLERYLEAVRYCAGRFDVTNGEIIAGLEPPQSSIAAIDWLTSVGAIPTVCVFRPLLGTDLEDEPPPKTEDLIPVFRRLYEACMEKGLPIGIAPNVKVSLVLLPEEGRYFSDRAFVWSRAKNAARAAAFRSAFRIGQRLRYPAPARAEVPALALRAVEESGKMAPRQDVA